MENTLTWQEECTFAAIIYRIKKIGGIPTLDDPDWSSKFITKFLVQMSGESLIHIEEDKWQLTDTGQTFYRNLLGALDQAKKFEIFYEVWQTCSPDEKESDDGIQVYNGDDDPRVLRDRNSEEEPEDLRIAMMTYVADSVAEKVNTDNFSVEKVIFLQKLLDVFDEGEASKDFWMNLYAGDFFDEIEKISGAAYRWQDLAEDEDAAWETAQAVYTAGMLQQRKIDGQECGNCGAPLALQEAKNVCEECEADFTPPEPPPAEYECPQCKADIHSGQSVCSCGADINFSLPEGSVTETQETSTETDYSDTYYDDPYSYVPYGYYDVYDPIGDALAFGLLCCVLF